MAYDFLGTFKRSQFELLADYAEASLQDVDPRITYLKSEIERLGWIEYEFDEEGRRIDYNIQPPNSQLAKYALAFEYYGGSLTELQIRSRGDWIYITKGEFNLDDAAPYAGGKPSEGNYSEGSRHYDDTVPGNYVAGVKDWITPKIKRQLEDLEFRIKRTIDLSDQYIEEVVLLVKRSTGAETLEDLRKDIDFFITSEDFHSATDR